MDKSILIVFFCGILIWACQNSFSPSKILLPAAEDLQIELRWSKAFSEDSLEGKMIGLEWIMSYLGASVPPSAREKAIVWHDDRCFKLDVSHMGFNDKALEVWGKLIPKFKASDEYLQMGSMELGRFYLLTFNSSWHYYALTGVEENFKSFLSKYSFKEPIDFYAPQSMVANGDRKVFLGEEYSSLEKMAYYAIEGRGSILDGTFEAVDFETFDFMPNGQPRFAIYNSDGHLKVGSDPKLSIGGKPAKCMWCHESTVLQSFKYQVKFPKLKNFTIDILKRKKILNQLQTQLNTNVKYDSIRHHANVEMAYGSFMQCLPIHIAEEFELDSTKVADFVKTLACQSNKFFPEFDCYYEREVIETLQPYEGLDYPGHMWETTDDEPNYLVD